MYRMLIFSLNGHMLGMEGLCMIEVFITQTPSTTRSSILEEIVIIYGNFDIHVDGESLGCLKIHS